jgi:hypothetical protein
MIKEERKEKREKFGAGKKIKKGGEEGKEGEIWGREKDKERRRGRKRGRNLGSGRKIKKGGEEGKERERYRIRAN